MYLFGAVIFELRQCYCIIGKKFHKTFDKNQYYDFIFSVFLNSKCLAKQNLFRNSYSTGTRIEEFNEKPYFAFYDSIKNNASVIFMRPIFDYYGNFSRNFFLNTRICINVIKSFFTE